MAPKLRPLARGGIASTDMDQQFLFEIHPDDRVFVRETVTAAT
jgi:hypothetical protein